MSVPKVFKIHGEVMKKQFFEPMVFTKNVTAVEPEHALERVYAEIGSRHRAKRCQIAILSIEEVEATEKRAK